MMDLNNAHFTPSLSVSLFVHCDLFQALAPTSLRAQYALDPVAELQTKRTAVSLMPTPFARPTQPSNGSFFLGWSRNFPDKFRASSNIMVDDICQWAKTRGSLVKRKMPFVIAAQLGADELYGRLEIGCLCHTS
jgi:hypothetical protein